MFYRIILLLNTVDSKQKDPLILAFIICTFILLSSLSSTQVFASNPYASGFDHGCDDADISNPSNRYINQDEKGPSYHTDEFMEGYYDGFTSCEGNSGEGGNDWNDSCRDAGYDDGQNGPFSEDTHDHCGDEVGGDDAYYEGFIDGCMSVEGNTKDVCESATD